jgi:hypothetical protein
MDRFAMSPFVDVYWNARQGVFMLQEMQLDPEFGWYSECGVPRTFNEAEMERCGVDAVRDALRSWGSRDNLPRVISKDARQAKLRFFRQNQLVRVHLASTESIALEAMDEKNFVIAAKLLRRCARSSCHARLLIFTQGSWSCSGAAHRLPLRRLVVRIDRNWGYDRQKLVPPRADRHGERKPRAPVPPRRARLRLLPHLQAHLPPEPPPGRPARRRLPVLLQADGEAGAVSPQTSNSTPRTYGCAIVGYLNQNCRRDFVYSGHANSERRATCINAVDRL